MARRKMGKTADDQYMGGGTGNWNRAPKKEEKKAAPPKPKPKKEATRSAPPKPRAKPKKEAPKRTAKDKDSTPKRAKPNPKRNKSNNVCG